MMIISSFATKIQRQWKVYVFRKKVNEFLSKIKQEEMSEEEIKLEPKSNFFELKFDNTKIKRLVHF